MADPQLPHNDPDLQLARTIGKARQDGTSLSAIVDPLIEQVLPYRQNIRDGYHSKQLDKDDVWNSIERATKPSNSEASLTPLFSTQTMRWAAAAVLLIGALFSFVYLQYWDSPELLAASASSIQTVELTDGSTVTLRPYSKLFAMEQSKTSSTYKLRGEAWFEVPTKQSRQFTVQTANGRVSVLGTRFMLSTWANRTQVFLEKGSVKIETLTDGQSATLQPGESAAIQQDDQITLDAQNTAKEFTDWLDQQLIFEQKPVRLIADELEQQFNIDIILPDSIANSKLTGQLPLDDLQKTLDDLSLALGGSFQKKDESRYQFSPQ